MLLRIQKFNKVLLTRSQYSCPILLRPNAKSLEPAQEATLQKFPWPNYKLLLANSKPEQRVWTDFVKETDVVIKGKNVSNFALTFLRNRGCINDFNVLYREFHQWCSVPDFEGIEHACEKNFAKHMKSVIRDIHLAGLALDMERLTVVQPKMEILDFQIFKGIHVDRSQNGSINDYTIHKDGVYGLWPKCTSYLKKHTRLIDGLKVIEENHKPYLVRVKLIIHSHMRMYGYTKSEEQYSARSSPIGTDMVPNLVQFECNMKGVEFFKAFPIEGREPLLRDWKITDWNDAMKGNKFFTDA